ncbi:hypothetical protein MP638_002880 [Amoeboaphelidium occidentale]|nr:hypothetical protein MP638_002880 [Amoeboaphelidium occidentale]
MDNTDIDNVPVSNGFNWVFLTAIMAAIGVVVLIAFVYWCFLRFVGFSYPSRFSGLYGRGYGPSAHTFDHTLSQSASRLQQALAKLEENYREGGRPPVRIIIQSNAISQVFSRAFQYHSACKQSELETGSLEARQCSICLEDILEGQIVRQSSRCGHMFHRVCIDEWITRTQAFCPVCKKLCVDVGTLDTVIMKRYIDSIGQQVYTIQLKPMRSFLFRLRDLMLSRKSSSSSA